MKSARVMPGSTPGSRTSVVEEFGSLVALITQSILVQIQSALLYILKIVSSIFVARKIYLKTLRN